MRKNKPGPDSQASGPQFTALLSRRSAAPVLADSIRDNSQRTSSLYDAQADQTPTTTLPSLSSSTSISSSHSSLAPLSKMFSLPSRPSMRRLVPSPSMPSLRIDLRRERSSTDLREEACSSSSSSSSRTQTVQYKTASDHRLPPSSLNCPPVAASPTFVPRSNNTATLAKLQGARQMLMHSAKKRVTGGGSAAAAAARSASHTSTSSIASTSSDASEAWSQSIHASRARQQAELSPLSMLADLDVVQRGSIGCESDSEPRLSTSNHSKFTSPPIAERILPPDEMIATIDRMRNERLRSSATSSTTGLGLSGVNVQQTTDVMQRCRSSRSQHFAERNTAMTDGCWSSSSYVSPSSPIWCQSDAHPSFTSRSPTMTPFSSSSRGTSVGMTSVDSFCTPTLSSSPVQRSLPVPPRLGKKSRSHAQALNSACLAIGTRSAPSTTHSIESTRSTNSFDSLASPTSPLVECAELSSFVDRTTVRGALVPITFNVPTTTTTTKMGLLNREEVEASEMHARRNSDYEDGKLDKRSYKSALYDCSDKFDLDKENACDKTPVRPTLRNSFAVDQATTPIQQSMTKSSSANSFGVRHKTPDRRSSVIRTGAAQLEHNNAIHRISIIE